MKNAPEKMSKRALLRAERKEQRNTLNAVVVKDIQKTKIVTSYFNEDVASTKQMPFGAIFMICIIVIAVLFFTFLSVRVNQVQKEIAGLNAQLEDIRDQTQEVKANLAVKKDLTAIRKSAEDMGMVRAEILPSHNILEEAENSVTVYVDDEAEGDFGFAALLSALGDSIASFIEYIK